MTYDITRTDAGVYPNTASVTVQDNEGSTASDSDSKSVTMVDVKPTVDITKSASPTKLPWPGGEFTFTLTIKNTSVEPVTITALTDTNINPVPGGLIGQTLAPGEVRTVTYTITHLAVTEADAKIYTNTAKVTVKDNENNTASDTATANVEVGKPAKIKAFKFNDVNGDGVFDAGRFARRRLADPRAGCGRQRGGPGRHRR